MCRVRLLLEAFFFALVADVGPEGVQLRAAHLVIPEQYLFDLLHLWCGLEEPIADGLFLDAFDAMDGGERISFAQHRKTFDDGLLVVLLAVENCAFCFRKDLFACWGSFSKCAEINDFDKLPVKIKALRFLLQS